MKNIKVKTPAKINLTLEILNKRKDGFHNIQSIMQTINLYDFLTFKIDEDSQLSINLTGNSNEIPYDKSNIVYKAAEIFFNKTGIKNCKLNVYIQKKIPVAAGLAGGSSNAAGTLFALNQLYNNPLNDTQINELCSQLGSDVNFCLNGGCALCTSRGEIIETLPVFIQNVSLIKPKKLGISAKDAYMKFSQLRDKSIPNNTNKLKQLLLEGKFDKNLLYNSFEKAIFPFYEELQKIKSGIEGAIMSGSGSTFFILNDKIENNLFKNEEYDVFENLSTIQNGVSLIS